MEGDWLAVEVEPTMVMEDLKTMLNRPAHKIDLNNPAVTDKVYSYCSGFPTANEQFQRFQQLIDALKQLQEAEQKESNQDDNQDQTIAEQLSEKQDETEHPTVQGQQEATPALPVQETTSATTAPTPQTTDTVQDSGRRDKTGRNRTKAFRMANGWTDYAPDHPPQVTDDQAIAIILDTKLQFKDRNKSAPAYFTWKGLLRENKRYILTMKDTEGELRVPFSRAKLFIDQSKIDYQNILNPERLVDHAADGGVRTRKLRDVKFGQDAKGRFGKVDAEGEGQLSIVGKAARLGEEGGLGEEESRMVDAVKERESSRKRKLDDESLFDVGTTEKIRGRSFVTKQRRVMQKDKQRIEELEKQLQDRQ